MTALAPLLEAFFTERLIGQRQASPHTVASYRDSFRLLLGFTAERTGRPPSRLQLEDLDAPLVGAFLSHLQTRRHNTAATRNARLAAVHSMFRYAAFHYPEHAALIARVLAIPPKRTDRTVVAFLDDDEIDALLASPTAPCCTSTSRPDCGSPNLSGCAAKTSSLATAPTCDAPGKAARSESYRSPQPQSR